MTGELTLQAGIIGFILGLPGIVSIGPQNLRLLHAGLARAYPGATASTAFLSEILLVAEGIGGIGLSLSARPDAVALLQGAGAAFVAWSGIGTLRRRGSTALGRADSSGRGCVSAILAMLRVKVAQPARLHRGGVNARDHDRRRCDGGAAGSWKRSSRGFRAQVLRIDDGGTQVRGDLRRAKYAAAL